MKQISLYVALLCALVVGPIANASCEIELMGGDHLEHKDSVQNSLSQLVQGSGRTIKVSFLDVFDPDHLFQILHDSGVSDGAITQTKSYLDQAFLKSQSGQFDVIDGGFALLNAHHDPVKAAVNLCVVGKGCYGFSVGGDQRPYLSMGMIGPVVVASVDGIDAGEVVPQVSPFYLNAVVIRAEDRPDFLVANLFSALGSAQITYFVRNWAAKMNHTGRVSSLSRTMLRHLPEGDVAVEGGFLLFMQNMQARQAEIELKEILGSNMQPAVFNRPGNSFSISNVLARVAQYPLGKAFLNKYNIGPSNAEAIFKSLYVQLRSDILNP